MLSPFVFQSIVATPYWEQNLHHYDFPIDLVLGRIPKESPSQEVGFVGVDVGVADGAYVVLNKVELACGEVSPTRGLTESQPVTPSERSESESE